jgi:hypothetical protein
MLMISGLQDLEWLLDWGIDYEITLFIKTDWEKPGDRGLSLVYSLMELTNMYDWLTDRNFLFLTFTQCNAWYPGAETCSGYWLFLWEAARLVARSSVGPLIITSETARSRWNSRRYRSWTGGNRSTEHAYGKGQAVGYGRDYTATWTSQLNPINL